MVIGICSSKRIWINKLINLINRKMVTGEWKFKAYKPEEAYMDLSEDRFECDIFITDINYEETGLFKDCYGIVSLINEKNPACHIILFSDALPENKKTDGIKNYSYVQRQSRNNKLISEICSIADIDNDNVEVVKVNYKGRVYALKCIDIILIRTEGRYIEYHTKNKIYKEYKALIDIEPLLPSSFVRCNSGTIINMKHHTKINYADIDMDNGVNVKIGRTFRTRIFPYTRRYIRHNFHIDNVSQ